MAKQRLEQYAQQVISRVLKREVFINDDGSKDGMYDLRVGEPDNPEIAIECVRVINPTFAATWNAGPAKNPLLLGVKGDWVVTITDKANIKRIKNNLQMLIESFENRQRYCLRTDSRMKIADEAFYNYLIGLGVVSAICIKPHGTGRVYLEMNGGSGAIAQDQPNTVSTWVGKYLNEPRQNDILVKLNKSTASDCHVFIAVGPDNTPWLVDLYLLGYLKCTPSQPPDLPPPITGVWLFSILGGDTGLRWDGASWSLFST